MRKRKQGSRSIQISWLLLAAYILVFFSLKLYAFPVLPDEQKFLTSAENFTSLFAAYGAYDYAYGGAFWALLYIVKLVSGVPGASIVFLCMLVSPLFIVMRIADEKARILAVLFWLTMPMAWWHGKIISPDTLNVFLISLAIMAAWRRKPFWTCLLAGLIIGIKLNAVAIMPPLLALLGWRMWPLRRKQLIHLAAIPLGFLLGGAAWVINPVNSNIILKSVSATSPNPLFSLLSSLLGYSVTWDLVISAEPFSAPVAAVGYGCLLALAIWKRHVPLLCAALAFFSIASLFLVSLISSGWYWFPFFTFLFIALFLDAEKFRKTAIFLPILVLIAAGQIWTYSIGNIDLVATEAKRNWNNKELATCLLPTVKEIGHPVYIRSYDGVEGRIADLARGIIIPAAYRYQYIEADPEKMNHIRETVLVDTVYLRYGFYPNIKYAPTLCDGQFVMYVPQAVRKSVIEVP